MRSSTRNLVADRMAELTFPPRELTPVEQLELEELTEDLVDDMHVSEEEYDNE